MCCVQTGVLGVETTGGGGSHPSLSAGFSVYQVSIVPVFRCETRHDTGVSFANTLSFRELMAGDGAGLRVML